MPSPLLALPLVVLDEYDKAGPELRTAAFAYLAGASRYRAEGMTLDVHATAIVTLNDDAPPRGSSPTPYLRRSVVLDTSVASRGDRRSPPDRSSSRPGGDSRPLAPDLAPPAAELPRTHAWDCAPDAPRLPDRAGLGASSTSRRSSRLVLGRWAQDARPRGRRPRVGADYLLVTATREGLVEPDWPARLEAVAGRPTAPIAATISAARARQGSAAEREATAARATLNASLALAGERERMRDALDYALRSAPGAARSAPLSAPRSRPSVERHARCARRSPAPAAPSRCASWTSGLKLKCSRRWGS